MRGKKDTGRLCPHEVTSSLSYDRVREAKCMSATSNGDGSAAGGTNRLRTRLAGPRMQSQPGEVMRQIGERGVGRWGGPVGRGRERRPTGGGAVLDEYLRHLDRRHAWRSRFRILSISLLSFVVPRPALPAEQADRRRRQRQRRASQRAESKSTASSPQLPIA